MTETDYLHECNRAELLGLPKPSRDEFFSHFTKTSGKEDAEDKEMTAEEIQDTGIRQEKFRRIGGGLDELNSILSSTQKKINRFKVVFGSFSNLLKLQTHGKKEESEKPVHVNVESDNENQEGVNESKTLLLDSKLQSNEGGNSQLDKLDSLISKAERAELSLSSQNKQMKKFIN